MSHLTPRARDLRQRQTQAETVLWKHLRNRQLAGAKFFRQKPVGNYIADFVCFDPRVLVEADGAHHRGSQYDATRDAWFRAGGYIVLRFWNNQIMLETEAVLERIRQAVDMGRVNEKDVGETLPHPNPLSQRERA
jgi:2-isopropylmalate synthase